MRDRPPRIRPLVSPRWILPLSAACLIQPASGAEPAPREARWDFRARIGLEVDVEGEVLGAEEALEPGQTVDAALQQLRFRDASTRTSASGSIDIESLGGRDLRLGARIKAAPSRSRGSVEGGCGIRTAGGRFGVREELIGEWGDEASGGGWLQLATGTWTGRTGPESWSLLASFTDEESVGSRDSTDRLFDYRVMRPHVQLAHPLWGGDAALRVGLSRKWAEGFAYRATWIEGEWTRAGIVSTPSRIRYRSESRTSLAGEGAPSGYQQSELEVAQGIEIHRALSIDANAASELWQYAVSDDTYRDHASSVVTTRLLWSQDPSGLEPSNWWVAAGVRGSWLGHAPQHDRDYTGGSILAEAGRTSLDGFWFDASLEAGGRKYRRSGSNGTLWLEGLDFSISGSDYRFLRVSILGEWNLPAQLRAGCSIQYEREDHEVAADDLTLWLLNTSFGRAF